MQSHDNSLSTGVIQVDQFQLGYQVIGQGKPALVIGSAIFYPRTFSKDLAEHLRMYFIDHAGFAPVPAESIDNSRFDLDHLINDIETMRKALDLDKFIIIGHSGHGYLALEYAKRYPQHVTEVIMIATAPNLSPAIHQAADDYFNQTATAERKQFLEHNLAKLPQELAAHRERRFAIVLQLLGARSWFDYRYDAAPLWQDVFMNMHAIDYMWGVVFRDIDITKGLEKFEIPVLLVLGNYDFLIPESRVWDSYKPKFKDLTVHVLEQSGHTPQLEQPELFDKIVLEWLQEKEQLNGQLTRERLVNNNGVTLWAQSFGNPKNPAILLISGAGAPAAFWTPEFIKHFVDNNYFVIRFDNRDTGLSSAIDYEKAPYTALDLASDAIAILDAYHIKKAHVVGHSMGGLIAQLLAIYYPEHILSIHSLSMGTVGGIGAPPQEVMQVLMANKPTQNFQESLPGFMKSWQILNGDLPFDNALATEYTRDMYVRSHHPVGVAWNHIKAQEGFADLKKELASIKVPAFFIHGEKDPLIPVQAGIATAQAIPNSKMVVVHSMGHMMFNRDLEHDIANIILDNLQSVKD
ncbi:MAG: alpha/beta fold hydrolase [Candidatus Babeliales bacterium]